MQAKQSRINARGFRGLKLIGLAFVAALALGCQANKSDSSPSTPGLTSPEATTSEASRPAPPTYDELAAHVQLSADQVQPMKDALETWRQAALTLAQEQRTNREKGAGSGHGPIDSPSDHEPPMLAFLEASAKTLKSDQFIQLAAFLAERREAFRQAHAQAHQGQDKGFAGRPPDGGPPEGRMIDILTDQLNLTTEQQEQIHKMHEDIRKEIDSLHSEYGDRGRSSAEFRQKMKALHDSIQERMQAILTSDQYAKLQALQKERQASMAERQDERATQRINRLGEFLGNVLSLSPTQKQQVSEILSNAHKQLTSLHERMGDSSTVAGDRRQEFEKIRTDADAAIRALLTADQAKLYDALKSLLPAGGLGEVAVRARLGRFRHG